MRSQIEYDLEIDTLIKTIETSVDRLLKLI